MILTAHQPLYLPWLGLFHKIALSDVFCLFDDSQYDDNDFQNRNRIKGPNGPMWLTVPVQAQNHYQLKITDVEIVDRAVWRRKHWKSLLFAYHRAPYFAQYADFFEETYQREWRRLVDLNVHLLRFLLGALGLPADFPRTSELGLTARKSEAIIEMCCKLGATTYIFGEQGRHYADVAAFEAANIRVVFQDYRHPTYPQQFGEFVSHMSVVDLLFNSGPHSLDAILFGNLSRASILRSRG